MASIVDMPRIYVREDKVYLIRELREGRERLGLEYGVYSPQVGIAWRPCQEGDKWDKVEPFGPVYEMVKRAK